MTFPANYTVPYHSYSAGTATARNTPTAVYTPPLDQPGTELKVIDIAPVRGAEPNATRIVDRRKLHAPPDCPLKAQDVVDLPEGRFEVDGDMEDQTRGFHGWNPGVVVWLKRTQK